MQGSASLSELTHRAVSKMQTRRVTRSPIERDVNLASLRWANDKGLVGDDLSEARLIGVECGAFASCSYQNGSREMVQLCADFVAWLFLFDDRYCEAFDADVAGLRLFFREYEALIRHEDARPLTPFQAALFDVKERGYLREGYFADLVLIDDEPFTVKREDVLSKVGWSPFEGRTFRSRVGATWVNGRMVWNGEHLVGTPVGQRLEFAR